jgi:plasmid stabilization system protein ParE
VGAPRHLIAYLTPAPDLVVVVRVLHDAMELERHLAG